jgi:modulator of FtsH protease
MQKELYTATQPNTALIEAHQVVRNTYLLLSMTLFWSAAVAAIAMTLNAPMLGLFPFLIGTYGSMYMVHKYKNRGAGIAWIFIFTGILGYSIGPILNLYLRLHNGGDIIMQALGSTGLVFLSLSAYALISRKDFSFLSGFIFTGMIVLIMAMVASIFFNTPLLQLAISGGFVLFSSACILFQTGQIINGGERNYIIATISLYVSIYNLFLSLLRIFGALRGN